MYCAKKDYGQLRTELEFYVKFTDVIWRNGKEPLSLLLGPDSIPVTFFWGQAL